jgi:hypothetical protein
MSSALRISTDVPGLEQLPDLVHQHRRLIAGQVRIDKEIRALNERIETHLNAAGTDAVMCTIALGRFEVRRAVTRDGRRYATVTPIKDVEASADAATSPTRA